MTTEGDFSASRILSCIDRDGHASSVLGLVASACLLIAGCSLSIAQSARDQTLRQRQKALSSLITQIQSDRVQSVEILYIPTYIVHNVNITPERLRNDYRYK